MQFELDLSALKGKTASERAEIEAKIAQLRQAVASNPMFGYMPYPKQQIFHESIGTKIRAFVAGNRAGKSHAGVMDDLIQCVDRDVLPPWLLPYKRFEPPCYVRIVTPDLTTTGEGVIVDKLRTLTPASQLVNSSWSKSFDGRRLRLSFANGSHIDFLSTGQDLDKHGGAGVHRVHFDEEPHGRKGERMFVEAVIRTTDYGGDILFTMTPIEGLTWTYDELADADGKPLQTEKVFVQTASMFDNPHLNAESREESLNVIKSEEERKSRIEGKWVALEGLIYPEFSPGTHVIPEPERIPPDVNIFVGIDPGYRYQAAAVFGFVDRYDCITVFDEVIVERGVVRQMVDKIRECEAKWEISPRWYVMDPANPTSHQTGLTDQAAYAKHGLYAILGRNARGAGFSVVRERLQEDPPRLLITANCDSLIYQFKHYRWKKESQGEDDGREAPVKKDDHALDALRYLLMSNPFAPKIVEDEENLSPADRAFRQSLERMDNSAKKSHHPLGGVYY